MSELATDLPPIILAPPDRGTATVLPAILAQPAPSSVVVVPVAGAQGPPGDTGPQGPTGEPGIPGDARALSYLHNQSAPALLVQIVHGLGFRPAGVLCIDTLGDITEPDTITYPSDAVTEISFGAAFTGVVNLS